MIEIDGLTKRYGKFTALDAVSLRAQDGEIYGFLGPNGAGKTTTIKSIAGLIKPTAGDVRVDGLSMRQQPLLAKQRLGVVPDRPFLYEKLTGLEFLAFMCGLYRIPPAQGVRSAHELLRLFELEDWGDQLVEGYSHGMKQRLVMASALIHDPTTLVIDEPMVGLDARGARLLKRVLRTFAQRGRAIFLSTHSLPVAEELCDRIAVISHGKVVAEGTLDQLRAAARTQGDLESVVLALTREARDEGKTEEALAADLLDAVMGNSSGGAA